MCVCVCVCRNHDFPNTHVRKAMCLCARLQQMHLPPPTRRHHVHVAQQPPHSLQVLPCIAAITIITTATTIITTATTITITTTIHARIAHGLAVARHVRVRTRARA